MATTDHPKHTVQITIDGRPFEVEAGHHLTATDLLRLAGLDPSGYDLAQVRGHGEIIEFDDSQTVTVHKGEKFVSVRQVAPVA
ncbi:multiubiquitin domain-containing protein [Nocardia colli]|uniref:multiubiquitin domain-containing protein n=1 Tax=Nocardia colli TaxID=2545717 RepID=UPI0035E19D7D